MFPSPFKAARGASPALILAGAFLLGSGNLAAADIASNRQAELVKLVRNDCGSCHGLTLSGGLGPALLPETLAGKPEEALRETILRGRTGTAMPPWSAFVSEAEAVWIVNQLIRGFPNAH